MKEDEDGKRAMKLYQKAIKAWKVYEMYTKY